MATSRSKSNVKYVKEFKGGSMAKTYLIEKNGELLVRKEVQDTSGLGIEKLEKQADWILELENEVAEIFPIIDKKDFGKDFGYYDMSYHDMPSFRDYLVEVGEVNEDIKRILREIVAYSAKISSKEEISNKDKKSYVKKSHLDKMEKRCEIVVKKDDTFRILFNVPEIIVNGTQYLNFHNIINKISNDSKLLELLSPKKWYRSHGDFTFQNVLTDGKNFKIIDPRGEGEDSLYYDISKLFQSCQGKYDLFSEGNYNATYSLNNNSINYEILNHESLFDEALELIKQEIPKAFSLEKDWEIIALFYEASHFVSMVPFRYEENLPFTLACYGIGIKKLNEVYERWQKHLEEE